MPEADIREVYTLVDFDTGEAESFEDKSEAYQRWIDWTEEADQYQNAMFVKAEIPEWEGDPEDEDEDPPDGDQALILGLRFNGFMATSGKRSKKGTVIPDPPDIDFNAEEE